MGLTKVGLQELYNFKVENPHVDLEPFLAQSSQYFRDYIERGLKKIEEEVKAPAPSNYTSSGIARPSVLTDNVGSAGGQPQHLVYLERLKRLRAAGGLSEPVDQENVENYSKSGPTQPGSGYTSGIGTGYSSVRAQSSVSNQRYSALTSTDSTDNYQEENQNAPTTNVPNVDEIRKRLAKIKAQAF